MNKKNIPIKFDIPDYNVLEELSAKKRLPVATLIRTLVIESKEFQDMNEEIFQVELNKPDTEFLSKISKKE
jgi:hypothetical protein